MRILDGYINSRGTDREPISRFDLPSSLCDAPFCNRYGEQWVKEVKPSFFFLLVATPFIRKTGEKEAEEEHRSRRESLKYFDSGMRAIEIFLKSFDNFPCLLTFLHFPMYLYTCVCVNPSIHNFKLYHYNLSKLHYNFWYFLILLFRVIFSAFLCPH